MADTDSAGGMAPSSAAAERSGGRFFGGARRGQGYTIEALVSAFFVLGALLVITQGAGLTPVSEGTVNNQLQHQERVHAADVLDTTSETGDLKAAILHYNRTDGEFVNSTETQEGYTHPSQVDTWGTDIDGEETRFPEVLNETFATRNVAVNVDIIWMDGDDTERKTYLEMGSPSGDAVQVTRPVTLYTDDEVTDGTFKSVALGDIADDPDEPSFYIGEGDTPSEETEVYKVIRVRLTVWQL